MDLHNGMEAYVDDGSLTADMIEMSQEFCHDALIPFIYHDELLGELIYSCMERSSIEAPQKFRHHALIPLIYGDELLGELIYSKAHV